MTTLPRSKLSVSSHSRVIIFNFKEADALFSFADGVVLVDPEYLKGRKLFGQIVCSFRYGREEDEVMGLQFQKDLLMASGEIQPTQKKDLTKMQVQSDQQASSLLLFTTVN